MEEADVAKVKLEPLLGSYSNSESNNQNKLISENDVKEEIEEFTDFEVISVDNHTIKIEIDDMDMNKECSNGIYEYMYKSHDQVEFPPGNQNKNLDCVRTVKKNSRAARCSNEQFRMMVNYMAENRVMLQGNLAPDKASIVNKKWKELGAILNQCKGAKKTAVQWKRAFIEYKSKTKSRARDYNRQISLSGGHNNARMLNEHEMKLMSLLGWISVNEDPQLSEPELSNSLPVIETSLPVVSANQDQINPIEEIMEIRPLIEMNPDIDINPNVQINHKEYINEKMNPHEENAQKIKLTRKINTKNRKKFVKPKETNSVILEIMKNSKDICSALNNISTALLAVAESNNNIAKAIQSVASNSKQT